MMKLRYLTLILSIFLSACDVPEGYEKELIENDTWPQVVSGTFSFLDSDTGDGKYAEWAIGIIDVPSKSDSILIEFRGNVLKDAGIDLEFNVPDPVTLSIGPPKERYFQVQGVVKQ
jgi:hypothetical protein